MVEAPEGVNASAASLTGERSRSHDGAPRGKPQPGSGADTRTCEHRERGSGSERSEALTLKGPVAVVGSSGMLGGDLVRALRDAGHDVIALPRDELDVTDPGQVGRLAQLSPSLLVNCAAYTKVDLAERERDLCYAVNVMGAEHLALLCGRLAIPMVQLSTDYVFDGEKDEGYDEDDPASPLGHYGTTKALAEEIVRGALRKHYIVRTSWLFGHGGENFVEKILARCARDGNATVVADQRGSPTSTRDLSRAIARLIGAGSPYGTYHLTNEGRCTWHEFAQEIARLASPSCVVMPCASGAFPAAARRPRNSGLNNNKAEKLRHWKEALKEYLEERT